MGPWRISPLFRGPARLAGPRRLLRRIFGPQAVSEGALVAYLTLNLPPWSVIIRFLERHLLPLLFPFALRGVQSSPDHRQLQVVLNPY